MIVREFKAYNMIRYRYKISLRFSFIIALSCLFSMALIFISLSKQSFAQTSLSVSYGQILSLKDGQDSYPISPYVYVTPDPKKQLNYKTFVNQHLSGRNRGHAIEGNAFSLGASAVPHWVAFTLNNNTHKIPSGCAT